MSFRRMAGFAGIASVVCFIVSFVAYGTLPSIDASASEVAKYISDSGGFALANGLGALAGLFMVVFFVGFANPFKAADREHGEGFGTVIVGTAVMAATAMGIGTAMFSVLANRIAEFEGGSLWALWDGGNLAFGFAILTFAFGGGAAAVAIMRRGVMPTWFGYLTGIVAIAALTSLTSYFTSDSVVVVTALVGYLGIVVWLLAGSVLMLRKTT